MVSLIPSELGLTMYSEFLACMAATAAAEEKCAARAAAAADDAGLMEAPPGRWSVEAHKVGHYFYICFLT